MVTFGIVLFGLDCNSAKFSNVNKNMKVQNDNFLFHNKLASLAGDDKQLFARLFLRGGHSKKNCPGSKSSDESDSMNCYMDQHDKESYSELAAETVPVNSSKPTWTDIPGPHSYSEESEIDNLEVVRHIPLLGFPL